MRIPFTITANAISVFHKGRMFNLPMSHRRAAELKDHLRLPNHDINLIEDIVDVRQAVVRLSKGNVKIADNSVFYKGNEIRSSLAMRMVSMLDDGFEITPWINFMEKVMLNPSVDSRERLFDFIEVNESPITEDGDFLTFKRVRSNFLDHYTGTMDNRPGTIVQVERSKVDPNIDRTCSNGLHVCASIYLDQSGYANSQGAKTLVCKVHPTDVVAIPRDYNNSKMRVSRYEVLSEASLGEIREIEKENVILASSDNILTTGVLSNVTPLLYDILDVAMSEFSNDEYEIFVEAKGNVANITINIDDISTDYAYSAFQNIISADVLNDFADVIFENFKYVDETEVFIEYQGVKTNLEELVGLSSEVVVKKLLLGYNVYTDGYCPSTTANAAFYAIGCGIDNFKIDTSKNSIHFNILINEDTEYNEAYNLVDVILDIDDNIGFNIYLDVIYEGVLVCSIFASEFDDVDELYEEIQDAIESHLDKITAPEPVFKTTSGMSFTQKEILDGVAACGSATKWAKSVGVAESTARGWITRIIDNS